MAGGIRKINGAAVPEIEFVKTALVVGNPINPRLIKTAKFDRLVKNLARRPDLFRARPIICSDRTGKLVALGGNMRLAAAKRSNLDFVPVIIMRGLDEGAEKEISILDNGEFGEWDYEILANHFDGLDLVDLGVDGIPPAPVDDLGGEGEGGGDQGQAAGFPLIFMFTTRDKLARVLDALGVEPGDLGDPPEITGNVLIQALSESGHVS